MKNQELKLKYTLNQDKRIDPVSLQKLNSNEKSIEGDIRIL